MELTKEEAIANHRKMWNWIADETERQKRVVLKIDYFFMHGFSRENTPASLCYCCEYDRPRSDSCKECPIDWGSDSSFVMCECRHHLGDKQGFFAKWDIASRENKWKAAAKYARIIANLPERKFEGE